ncbi:MAG: hypothetical protein AB7E47_07255 [Desulfovibrionaceae bacterium]
MYDAIERIRREHTEEMTTLRRSVREAAATMRREYRLMDREVARLRRQHAQDMMPKKESMIWHQIKWVFNILL